MSEISNSKEESEKWLNEFIRDHAKCFFRDWRCFEEESGIKSIPICNSIDDLVILVNDFLEEGIPIDGWCFDNEEVSEDEFWYHYGNYVGKTFDKDDRLNEDGDKFIQCCA